MNPLEEIFLRYKKTGDLHHAYLIESEGGAEDDTSVRGLTELIAAHLMPTRGNADFWQGNYESFGIDEGRALKEMQQKMASAGSKKAFVIVAVSITREAQNSLLKMFEEPTSGSHFFLLMPSIETLLPTFRSRLMIVDEGKNGRNKTSQSDISEARKFIKISKPERLKFLAPLIEEVDRRKAVVFLDGLEQVLAEDKKSLEKNSFFLAELYAMKSYLHDRSSSVKMILEHLALIL